MVKELAARLRTRPLSAADSQELEQLFVVSHLPFPPFFRVSFALLQASHAKPLVTSRDSAESVTLQAGSGVTVARFLRNLYGPHPCVLNGSAAVPWHNFSDPLFHFVQLLAYMQVT